MDGERVLNLKIGFIFNILFFIIAASIWVGAGSAQADIYSWKDADGVLHFSNHAPPAEAEFHMVEYFAEQAPDMDQESRRTIPPPDSMHAQLEEANRKLEAALDKVDDLTEKVEQTRREASEAAEAARRAAAEAQAAKEAQSEKTVVFGLPYRPSHHPPHPTPYYWQLDSSRYPYYHERHDHIHDKGDKPHPRGPVGARHSGTIQPIAAPAGGMNIRR